MRSYLPLRKIFPTIRVLVYLLTVIIESVSSSCLPNCACSDSSTMTCNYLTKSDVENVTSSNITKLVITNGNFSKAFPLKFFNSFQKIETIEIKNLPVPALLPYTFSNLRFLKTIEISQTKITNISKHTFYTLSSLTSLKIISSEIAELEEFWIYDAVKLVHVDISKNLLRTLKPHFFTSVRNTLVSINILNNKLSDIEENTFKNFQYLNTVLLDFNELTQIKASYFKGLSNLRVLGLNRNKIQSIDVESFQSTTMLNHLYLFGNSLGNVPPSVSTYAINLGYLDLRYNKISSIKSEHFQSLIGLETLNLDGNSLETLDFTTFEHNTLLKILSLSGNQIKKIAVPKNIEFPFLESLDLNSNIIEHLTTFQIPSLTGLKTLSINNNNIRTLDPNIIITFKKLEKIAVSNNPVDGNCNTLAFLNAINAKRTIVDDLDNSKFKTPLWLENLSLLQMQLLLQNTTNTCIKNQCFGINCVNIQNKYNKTCPYDPFVCPCQNDGGYMTCDQSNDCRYKECLNGGQCVNKTGSYECICDDKWMGPRCEKEKPCPQGYFGHNCTNKIYTCQGTECKNNGTCIPQISTYKCDCPNTYTGDYCQVKVAAGKISCQGIICQPGEICQLVNSTPSCRCENGESSGKCDQNVTDENGETKFEMKWIIIIVCVAIVTIFVIIVAVRKYRSYVNEQKRKISKVPIANPFEITVNEAFDSKWFDSSPHYEEINMNRVKELYTELNLDESKDVTTNEQALENENKLSNTESGYEIKLKLEDSKDLEDKDSGYEIAPNQLEHSPYLSRKNSSVS